jgi:hypothetical protein
MPPKPGREYEGNVFTTLVQMRFMGSLGAEEGLFTETTAYDLIHHIQLLKPVQIILFLMGKHGLPYV